MRPLCQLSRNHCPTPNLFLEETISFLNGPFHFVFSIQLKVYVQFKFLLMTGFEPRTSGLEGTALPTKPQPLPTIPFSESALQLLGDGEHRSWRGRRVDHCGRISTDPGSGDHSKFLQKSNPRHQGGCRPQVSGRWSTKALNRMEEKVS